MSRPAAMKHLPARDFHAHLAPLLCGRAGGAFTTVALIREPLSWVQSWYRFRLRDDRDDPQHLMSGKSFETFVQDYLADSPAPHADLGRQSDFLCDDRGGLMVDHLFRYEDMDRFVHFLEDRLDCIVTLPRVNVPPAVDVALSPASEARLRQHLAADAALYAAAG
ncbi:hypothetical protein ACEYYB_00480 [Paracoccus sp. p4-l81]